MSGERELSWEEAIALFDRMAGQRPLPTPEAQAAMRRDQSRLGNLCLNCGWERTKETLHDITPGCPKCGTPFLDPDYGIGAP